MSETDNTDEPVPDEIRCTGCSGELPPGGEFIVDEQPYCEDCTFWCEWHGARAIGDDHIDIHGERCCQNCYEDRGITCDRCDGVLDCYNDPYNSVGGGDYSYCENCTNRLLRSGDFHQCSCDGDYSFEPCECDECMDNRYEDMNDILPYEYRPAKWFFHDSREEADTVPISDNHFYMGLEVEMIHRRGNVRDAVEYWYNNVPKQVGFLKYDGSIGHEGFEVVTHPMTLDWARNSNLTDVFTGLQQRGMRAWGRQECGLHISVARRAFRGEAHQTKFAMLIFHNRTSLVQLVGRESPRYASFYENGERPKSTKLVKNPAHGGHSRHRYMAVNFDNPERLEVRMFRPSMLFSTDLAMMEFCEAAYEYTKHLPIQNIHTSLQFSSFRRWVENSDRYSLLASRINERVRPMSDEEFEGDNA